MADVERRPSITLKLHFEDTVITKKFKRQDVEPTTLFEIPNRGVVHTGVLTVKSMKTSMYGLQATWEMSASGPNWPINEFVSDGTISGNAPAVTKATVESLPKMAAFINGTQICQENLSADVTKSSGGLVDVFGKTARICFTTAESTKSGTGEMTEAELYIPKEIQITSPEVKSEEDVNPLCYYKDLVLRWNEDPDNSNGVLVVIEWYGSMVLGDDIDDTYVRRVCEMPDNGEAKLPEELFDDIPDTAYCHLTVLRGNVKNLESGEYTYKLLGETHQQITIILLREVCEK